MRIYILSNINVKKNTLAKLEPYLSNTRYVSYIWSMDGLLQVENEKKKCIIFRMMTSVLFKKVHQNIAR